MSGLYHIGEAKISELFSILTLLEYLTHDNNKSFQNWFIPVFFFIVLQPQSEPYTIKLFISEIDT